MIENTDFAYAAGYIDGDGCFSIGKVNSENRIRYKSQIIINTTEIENVHWFHSKFGGNIITKHVKSIHKPIHRYVLRSEGINSITAIEQYLVEKIDEFKIFDKFRKCTDKFEKEYLIKLMSDHKKTHNLIPFSIKKSIEEVRNIIEPTIEDFAYLAGFVDAECCLNIQKSHPKNRPYPTYKIQLQCNNSKYPCFYWISKRFGGQFHFIDRSKYPNNRNQITWRLSASSLFKILEKIHPFLKHKKPVCEELIKFYKTNISTGHVSPNSPHFHEFYKPIRELRKEIFHKIQLLNKKGI